MKKTLNLLAFDLGASNGRAILGAFDGKRVQMREIHRFDNPIIDLHGMGCWDTLLQYQNLVDSFAKLSGAGVKRLDCFGIDTWGVDYGLLDKNGVLLGPARSYRGYTDADMAKTHETVSSGELFDATGIAPMSFNTVYQLHRRSRDLDVSLGAASDLLFTPDLLGYFLTGEKMSEYTISTTSGLYNVSRREWDAKLMERLNIPSHIFGAVQMSGSLRGSLTASIAAELGINPAPFAAVGSHDTASAVAAIPGSGSFAFCSSGTWSIIGVETDSPKLSDEVRDAGFSNEGAVQGGFRLSRNIMGLWVIQQCRREWQLSGEKMSWDDITALSEAAEPLRSIIDINSAGFYTAGNMLKKIRDYCQKTGQPVPETIGQTARCVYESLALQYRAAIESLERIKGQGIGTMNITGGGIQNRLLCKMAACAIKRPVVTGPVEGAALGNVLMQALALGELRDVGELREVVRASVETETYEPTDIALWDEAYGRLMGYKSRFESER